ncbi:hypothetical protein SAMN05216203_1113 [Marinobacter daqiaonensis]|uniref:Proteins of 100 residues with WXG n=1 Tax=Marinobacter daqiaonensis TaxID=650891 RepID=A0A1I6HCM8_9GAMM|nr:hypothetical protein [Marinobacter daqiaonensis]SFR52276.1 hypothetical protein SAMN05216203_1113 [Marinobacter daqiaonensis]
MTMKDDLNKLSETVKQYRDELRVQLHLAKQDVQDEWDDLDRYWDQFRHKLDEIRHSSDGVTQDTRDTAHKLGEDLREGYERIRKRLK